MWLRTASKDDIDAICNLLNETCHAAYDDVFGVEFVNKMATEHHTPDALRKCLTRPSSEYVVADNGEDLHGVAYAVQGAIKGNPDIALLCQLYVRPESQRQGIGSRLLMEVEQCFPSARRIHVIVNEKDKSAITFLENQDYKKLQAKTMHGAEKMDFPEIVMEKVLF